MISKDEWYYEAWFASPVDGYYLVEEPAAGFKTKYSNTGSRADETDRCYNGGTIVNHKVPKTGDSTPLGLWFSLALLGVAGIGGLVFAGRKRKTQEK